MVPAPQHLHERTGGDVVVERREDGDLGLRPRTAHVRMEHPVGVLRRLHHESEALLLRAALVGRAQGRGLLVSVAGEAVPVHDGPHLGGEAPRTHPVAVHGLDLLDLALVVLRVGDRHVRAHGAAVVLMATRARDALARHARHPRAHQLERRAVRVERLERDRRVRGHFEAAGAVRLHVHRTEHALDVPAGLHAVESGRGVSAGLVVVEVVREHAQLLHGAARHAREALAGVDVRDVDGAGLHARHGAVGDDRGTRTRPERHRLAEESLRVVGEDGDVVEHVHEAHAHRRVGRGLDGREHVPRVERVGIGEVRFAAVELVLRVAVRHVPFHVLAPAGILLHEAGLLLRVRARGDAQVVVDHAPVAVGRIVAERVGARERGVHEEHAPHLGAVVVSAAEHGDEVRVAGDAPRLVEERRHPRARAPERELAHAVGVHRHEDAREEVRNVRVLPARVHDAPVVRDRGRVVAVLLVRELAHLARLAVDAVEHAHRHVAVLARQELVRARAEHHHLVLVRQVAAVPPLDVIVAVLGRNKFRPKIKWAFGPKWGFAPKF